MGNGNSIPLLSNVLDFQRHLIGWYKRSQRKLPWRTAPTAYKTVVSEFMLQQTQVITVLPYFERWITQFPDFKSLAATDEANVLKHWEGLGYYSRARNLHALAKKVAELDTLPKKASEWTSFKGIGPYTAAAIASIAFNEPTAVVDGNVIRILSRITANGTLFKDNSTAFKAFTPLAQSLINKDEPGDHNQAMMELGATVCTKKNPLCTTCPVLRLCEAAKHGNMEIYPNLLRKQITQHTVERAWVVHEGKLLLHKKTSSSKRLADLSELPESKALLGSSHKKHLKTLLLKKKRGISNQRIEESIYEINPTPQLFKQTQNDSSYYWVCKKKLETITLSGPHRKWVQEILSAMPKTTSNYLD